MSEQPTPCNDVGLQWGLWKWSVKDYAWVGGGEGGVPPQPPPSQNWQTKYTDHYPSDPSSNYTVLSGTWAWESASYYKQTGSGRGVTQHASLTVGGVKFYIKVLGKCTETTGDNNLALAYFIQDLDNMYVVGYSAILDRFFVMKRVAGVETTLVKQDAVLAGGYGVDLQIYAEYEPASHTVTATLYKGASLLSTLSYSDTTFTNGHFGLYAYKGARFDYIEVKEVVVTTWDFSFLTTPTSIGILQGANGSVTFNCNLVSGTAQGVSITCSNKPANVTVTPAPASGTPPFNGTITIAVGATVTPATYTITLQASGGGVSHNANITLTVGDDTSSFSDAFDDGSKDAHWNAFYYNANSRFCTITEVVNGLNVTSPATIQTDWTFAGYTAALVRSWLDGMKIEFSLPAHDVYFDTMVGLIQNNIAGTGVSEPNLGDGYFWYYSRSGNLVAYRRLGGVDNILFTVAQSAAVLLKIDFSSGKVRFWADGVNKYEEIFAISTRNLYTLIRLLTNSGTKTQRVISYLEQLQ